MNAAENNGPVEPGMIKIPPKGLAILALVGPAFIWCAEYIGSGEVIIATRTGAILGNTIIWAVVLGIFLKYWIGLCGARYTACTGEGMIDMFSRIPGPKNWVVWITLVVQFISATISIGSIATAAGIFFSTLLPLSSYLSGWIITAFCFTVAWWGGFRILKVLMTIFVFMIVAGVMYVALAVFPGMEEIVKSFMFIIPEVPQWAIDNAGVNANPWNEILPLLGWGAGGFASQVWYSYWVLGAGYGAAHGRDFGQPADLNQLKNMDKSTAEKIKGWCKVVYTDATLALLIGTIVTVGFLMAGAGVLGPQQLAPGGEKVATTLAQIFSSNWGSFGGLIFLISAMVALMSTQIGQLAGWPRLLADTFRICIPGFNKFSWEVQYRGFLLFFLSTNMIIVYTLGLKPVFMVQISAIMDGLLLTPLQALWVGIGLFIVMPKILSKEAAEILRPHWIFAVGLAMAFLVFGYFFIFEIPYLF
jgi:Mn2+/Fe2+ NRAMP family transporter